MRKKRIIKGRKERRWKKKNSVEGRKEVPVREGKKKKEKI